MTVSIHWFDFEGGLVSSDGGGSGGGGRFSKLEYFKYGRAPKLASMDWPDSANIGCDSPVNNNR